MGRENWSPLRAAVPSSCKVVCSGVVAVLLLTALFNSPTLSFLQKTIQLTKRRLEECRLPLVSPILRWDNSALSPAASVKLLPSPEGSLGNLELYFPQSLFPAAKFLYIFLPGVFQSYFKAVPLENSSQNKQMLSEKGECNFHVNKFLPNRNPTANSDPNQSLFRSCLKLKKFKFITQVVSSACRNWWHLYMEDCFTQVLKIS